MTKDEVMALSDEELRIKAGVLSGWHFHAVHEIDGRPQSRGWNRSPTDTAPETFVDLPDFVNDIAAAWELVEFVEHERHFTCSIEKNPLNGKWEVSFFGLDEDSGGMWRASPFFHAKDSVIARAITRAFVLAMAEDGRD